MSQRSAARTGLVRILAVCLAFAASGRAEAQQLPRQLEIHNINVQQGGATLLIGPNGTRVLLDSGKNGHGPTIVNYLNSIGIFASQGLHYTIASHMDADHVGGFDEVVTAGYDVLSGNWFNGSTKHTSTIESYHKVLATTTAGAPRGVNLGETLDLGDGARLTIVASGGNVIGRGAIPGAELRENDQSIAVLVQFGDFDFLWAGDLGGGDDDRSCTGRIHPGTNVETPLAQAIIPGGDWPLVSTAGIDVLYVNHHGSESSTNSDTMNLLRPEVALISVGAGQGRSWHHPRKDVVENVLLAKAPCITAPPAFVLQTDEGAPFGNQTSTAGYAVGDTIITTDGTSSYRIDATGNVANGVDERQLAGLPLVLPLDEQRRPTKGEAKVLLSEIFYDAHGSDSGLEWVELVNAGTTVVDLSHYSLASGGKDFTYNVVGLGGILAPGEAMIIGGPVSNGSNGSPNIDLPLDLSPGLQNSGRVADGVALFAIPPSQVTVSSVPIDVVVYGAENANGLIGPTGRAQVPQVGDAPPGHSIERVDFDGHWVIQAIPSPNRTSLTPARIVLSEILVNVSGRDDGLEWVELVNIGGMLADLSRFSLGSGGRDYTHSMIGLEGVLEPGEVVVVGGPASTDVNARPNLGIAIAFSPPLQNGGATADGMALFALPEEDVTPTSIPVDVVIYGTRNSNALIDAAGVVRAPDHPGASVGASLERNVVDGLWREQPSPTPNRIFLEP